MVESIGTVFSLLLQSSMEKMGTPFFSLLLLSCCLFSLPTLNHAFQARQLRKLIESRMPLKSSPDVSWSELDDDKYFNPVYVSPQDGLKDADMIQVLPGQPEGVDFHQYAGYVTVEPRAGHALFYYFVESPQDSSTKPLVLWLNGGPGCSSLGFGAMQSLGAFRVNADQETLSRNMFAWNNVANVLFLESPVGVGFSYSNTTSDYESAGDKGTAEDAYTFLINWIERFPEYKNRDFFITGESYGGHYVPQLALTILKRNEIANQTIINLRGIAVGNAFVVETTQEATYEYLWRHYLVSDETYAMLLKVCNFLEPPSTACQAAEAQAGMEIGNIYYYNIYAPLCSASNVSWTSSLYMTEFDPCSSNYVTSYLNNPNVQKALHARPTSWEACRRFPIWNGSANMLPIVKQVIRSGIRVWLYGGDLDAMVPNISVKRFINELGLPIVKKWHPWYSNGEVAGYAEEYEGLTFVTVRGAGHVVANSQTTRALSMISSFLQGKVPLAE